MLNGGGVLLSTVYLIGYRTVACGPRQYRSISKGTFVNCHKYTFGAIRLIKKLAP